MSMSKLVSLGCNINEKKYSFLLYHLAFDLLLLLLLCEFTLSFKKNVWLYGFFLFSPFWILGTGEGNWWC